MTDPASPADSDRESLEKQLAYYRQRVDELAGQTVIADSNLSRARRELKQRRQSLAVLSDLHRTVRTDMSQEEISDRTIARFHDDLKMDRTVLLMRDRETFRPVAWRGFDEEAEHHLSQLSLPLNPADTCVLVTRATPGTDTIQQLRDGLSIPFFVATDVKVNSTVAGVIISGRMREQKPFFPPLSAGDAATLESVAGFLGAALENARLFNHARDMALSFARFVPREFLQFLNRDSILDVQLGDQTQQEMTILFSDIRSFTTISERMSPRETFDFINRYLRYAAPVIQQNGGFIDKYIGDAIMALFAGGPDAAVRAGIELQLAVSRFNDSTAVAGHPPIAVGAGLHTGTLMLGTIGFDERMESTVIADAVNLAARMEGLTKMYGASVLISGECLELLESPESFPHRLVDIVRVKGKQAPVRVYDVFAGDSEPRRQAKHETSTVFAAAFQAYCAGDFRNASRQWRDVLTTNHDDAAAALLLKRCEQFLAAPPDDDWCGITSLDHK